MTLQARTDLDIIEAAQRLTDKLDILVNEDAQVDRMTTGAYVEAWVWVPYTKKETTDE